MNFLTRRQKQRNIFYVFVVGVLTVVVIGWWVGNHNLISSPGGVYNVLGRLFGLLAAFTILLQVVLMSRIPLIEENFDLYENIDLHRLNGYAILISILLHTIFTVLGYAALSHPGLWRQFLDLNIHYEDVFKATLGTIVFFGATAISVKKARSRIKHEIWYLVHLLMYGAILLTFLHQIKTGNDLVGQKFFLIFWWMIYLGVFFLLLYYRFLRPVFSFLKHDFRISDIVYETPNIVSVYISGQQITDYKFKPGQYAKWHILNKDMWWQAHPFSFSSSPGQDRLRLTVKVSSGDYSSKIAKLKKGTAVIIDGPRGSFTVDRASENVVMIAGGIGITPYIPVIEDLLNSGRSVTLLYASKAEQEAAFINELQALQQKGLRFQNFYSSQNQYINGGILKNSLKLQPTYYVCGPDSMIDNIQQTLQALGVAKDQIISERFAF